jgi:hypothetical protein
MVLPDWASALAISCRALAVAPPALPQKRAKLFFGGMIRLQRQE